MNARDFDELATAVEDGINLVATIRDLGFSMRLDGDDLLVYTHGKPRRLPEPLGRAIEREFPVVKLAFVGLLESARAIGRARARDFSRRAPKRRPRNRAEANR